MLAGTTGPISRLACAACADQRLPILSTFTSPPFIPRELLLVATTSVSAPSVYSEVPLTYQYAIRRRFFPSALISLSIVYKMVRTSFVLSHNGLV